MIRRRWYLEDLDSFIICYSDRSSVKLDLDDMIYSLVLNLAAAICEYFNLKGFIIMESSLNSYHVIFDSTVTWEKNKEIMRYAANLSRNRNLEAWVKIQCSKGISVLRVGPKYEKPIPEIAYRFGSQDGEIANYLQYRKLITDALAWQSGD